MSYRTEASPNIALIKYWGKRPSTSDEERNLPLNPSLSMTLKRAKTVVEIVAAEKNSFVINNVPASESDSNKIEQHLARCRKAIGERPDLQRLATSEFCGINSANNFPQGTGMASSASAFAALTLAILAFELGKEAASRLLIQEASWVSALARRGSGSAARSLQGPWVQWSESTGKKLDTNWQLRDTVVIFSRSHKSVPSSMGHLAALESPLMPDRQSRLEKRLFEMHQAIADCDIHRLGSLMEIEALEMHQVARSGSPAIDYLLPTTQRFLDVLQKIPSRKFYFTLDAGPNVHLLSEEPIKDQILEMLASENLNADIWEDEAGDGAQIV